MFGGENVIFEGDTELEHYQVVDMVYEGRRGRVLFSGNRSAAFSGIPLDGDKEMLFDYIQRLYELVVHMRPKKLLIIGGGTYTLPTALLKVLSAIHIDVVEIDPGLDDIAEAFFGFTPDTRLSIIHNEGKKFLKTTSNLYDLIIIDAFTHLHIPTSLTDKNAAELINNRLTNEGIIAMNIICPYYGRSADIIRGLYILYREIFGKADVFPADTKLTLWQSQNLLLVGDKSTRHVQYGMRFMALSPPH